jgi:hypothetical protein
MTAGLLVVLDRVPMTPPWTVRLTLTDEGRGCFRGRFADVDVLGIFQRQDNRVVLCWRGVDKGRPTRSSMMTGRTW